MRITIVLPPGATPAAEGAGLLPLVPPDRSDSEVLDGDAVAGPVIATSTPLPQPTSVQEA